MTKRKKDQKPMTDERRAELSAGRLRGANNRIEAVKLRLSGATFEQIGTALGVGKTRAHQYVTKALDELAKELNEHSDRYRAFELRRLDGLISLYMADLHERNVQIITDPKTKEKTEIIQLTSVIKPRIGALLLKCIELRIDLLGIRRGREAPEDGAPRSSIEEALREIDEEDAPSVDFTVHPTPALPAPENGTTQDGGES